METLFTSLKETWNKLSVRTRIAGGVAAGIVFLALSLIAIFSGDDYQPLYTNLDLSDAASITTALSENNIPYRLADNGSSILVPADRVYQTRLTLAAQGLPAGGVVGFETFNTTRLGETEADRQLRYRIALEGELTRTIRSLDEVEDARVHLVIPPNSLFIRDTQPSTASVLLRLKPGAVLSQQQVRGITHLLATSVERLAPENITIMDTSGTILNDHASVDGFDGSAVSQRLELTVMYEQRLAANLRAMLERVYGYGKVVCLVSVQLDFDTVEQYQEIYSAPSRDGGLVRSQQSFSEFYTDNVAAFGVPGVSANIPGYVELDPEEMGAYRQESTVNYELNRTEIHQMTPPGGVEQISVSIWIDGDVGQSELDAVEASVVGALGLNFDRGDHISISAMPFQSDFTFVASDESIPSGFSPIWLFMIITGLILVLIVSVLVRKTRQKTTLEIEPGIEIAVGAEEEMSPEDAARLDVIQRLKRYSAERPKEFAQMLKSWLLEE
ncbi:MAG: flagellar M-ring protein FliF [Firmicutes bacterium]|nr:flagellar basal-body MS-ring/collar protein FliF [Bacillota bacterium]NLL88094.1 flagellar M-ring protein FliF [Bacillota bacterium]HKM17592.1 flagellar basal-body MS-ring/collar protein FliF [Limnochordia bacterium]